MRDRPDPAILRRAGKGCAVKFYVKYGKHMALSSDASSPGIKSRERGPCPHIVFINIDDDMRPKRPLCFCVNMAINGLCALFTAARYRFIKF